MKTRYISKIARYALILFGISFVILLIIAFDSTLNKNEMPEITSLIALFCGMCFVTLCSVTAMKRWRYKL